MLKKLFILTVTFIPFMSFSQDLSGIWKGFFTTGFGESKKYYKYEVQIEMNNGAISGVAYSYLNTDFFGKSQIEGNYNAANKKLSANETKLINFSSSNSGSVCLMHNMLTYLKVGEKESLEGTFSSLNNISGQACSQGYVLLERSSKSDFHKESFLAKTKPKSNSKKQKDKKVATIKQESFAKNDAKSRKNTLDGKEEKEEKEIFAIDTSTKAKETIVNTESFVAATTEHITTSANDENATISSFSSIPEIFQKRKNKLVKTIITHTPQIDISFYDNGEVDDDSITVYHNLNSVITHGRLSRQPIEYGFDASENNRLQSFIIVADNLGKIPPNSALMVIYTNNERYEVFIESDLKNNGEVRIIYEPIKKK